MQTADGTAQVAYVSGHVPHDRRSHKLSPIISVSAGLPPSAQTRLMLGDHVLPGTAPRGQREAPSPSSPPSSILDPRDPLYTPHRVL